MRRIRNFFLYLIGFLAILLLGLHLLFTYRAKTILQEAVKEISNNTYRLKAKKVRFFYRNTGIEASQIQLLPVKPDSKKPEISFDFISIRLKSIWHLFFKRSLEVESIALHKPYVVAYTKENQDGRKKSITASIRDVRDKLFSLIDVMNVKKLDITDAALKIYPAEADEQEFMFINHLGVHLQNIDIERAEKNKEPIFRIEGKLILDKPQLQLLDTNLRIQAGYVEANLNTLSVRIDSLALQQQGTSGPPQQVKLASIRVAHFDWQRYLQDGLIEVDSLMAGTGTTDLYFEKKQSRKTDIPQNTDSLKYKGISFLVHHTLVSNITYRLNTQSPGTRQAERMLLNLEGDSLYLKNFSIIHNRKPAFSLDQLAVAVRNYQETDEDNQYKSSFSQLQIDSQKLVLRNVNFETQKKALEKNYIRADIPEFQVNDYELEAVFEKRLSAKSIVLNRPNILLDIRKTKPAGKRKKGKMNEAIARISSSASERVNLEEVVIRDGQFTLLPTLNPNDRIQLSGLSMVVDASEFESIGTLQELISSIKSFNSNGFTITGRQMNLQVKDISLLKNPEGIRFGSVDGTIGKGKTVHLKGLTLLNDPKKKTQETQTALHASEISIDSGYINLEVEDIRMARKQQAAKPETPVFIDNLNLNQFAFKFSKGKRIVVSAALDMQIQGFDFREGHARWDHITLGASNPKALLNQVQIGASGISLEQPGTLRLIAPQSIVPGKNARFSLEAASLDIGLGLKDTKIDSLVIQDIYLEKPVFRFDQKPGTSTAAPVQKTAKELFKFSMNRFSMTDPAIRYTSTDSAGDEVQHHEVLKGFFEIQKLNTGIREAAQVITAGSLHYKSSSPQSRLGKTSLNAGSIEVKASDVWYNPSKTNYGMLIDSLTIRGVQHAMALKEKDSIRFAIESAGLINFRYRKGDSLNVIRLLNQSVWWLNHTDIQITTGKKNIRVQGLKAARQGSISMSFDSLQVMNRISRDSFMATEQYETSFDSIQTGPVTLQDIRYQQTEGKPDIHIGKLQIRQPRFSTEKDKRKLEDTINYRPLLASTIKKLPYPIQIDSVQIQEGRVDVYEISKSTGKRAHLFFSDIQGSLSSVKNTGFAANDSLRMQVRARLYGKSNVRLQFRQSYSDSLYGFFMQARMRQFPMTEMNQLLTPMIGLKIISGNIDSLSLITRGNDIFAYGTMDLRYHKLKARILKTPDTKKKFLISIANFVSGILIRKHDNGRVNYLFKERLQKRSQFNFWGKIALEGLLTNLGVKRDKKEKKKFRQALDTYGLPEHYWQSEED